MRKSYLTKHMNAVHLGVTYPCAQCDKTFSRIFAMKRHVQIVHDKDRAHKCVTCEAAFTHKYGLVYHEQTMHLGIKAFACPHCEVSYCSDNGLNVHIRTVHHQSRPHVCRLCSATFGLKHHLKKHMEYVHDIGKFKCDYCLACRNSCNAHHDAELGREVKLCRVCYRKATGYTTRIEKQWAEYVDEHLGTDGLMGTDDAMITLGGCSRKRPDRLYGGPKLVEVDECDEHQHLGTNYSCEQDRITELYDEPSICGKTMVVTRWNPHAYDGPKLTFKKRCDLFIEVKKHIRANADRFPPIFVVYMFYSKDNPNICKDLPHCHVNCADDIDALPFVNHGDTARSSSSTWVESAR